MIKLNFLKHIFAKYIRTYCAALLVFYNLENINRKFKKNHIILFQMKS